MVLDSLTKRPARAALLIAVIAATGGVGAGLGAEAAIRAARARTLGAPAPSLGAVLGCAASAFGALAERDGWGAPPSLVMDRAFAACLGRGAG